MSTIKPPTSSIESREKLAQLKWTIFIIGFFVIQAILWSVAITITATDPSHAVVPDYDQRAVQWEEYRAVQRASQALGWKVDIQIADESDLRGYRPLSLVIQDRQGLAVEGATVELEAFHRGRAGQPQHLILKPVGPGVYSTQLLVRHQGIWQFRGTATKADQTRLIDTRQTLSLNNRQPPSQNR